MARDGEIEWEARPTGGGLHLIKLCVGAESVADLEEWQAARSQDCAARGVDTRPVHVTRMTPKRGGELLDGGSLYWVIKGVVRCRQQLLDIEEVQGEDGITRSGLRLDPEIVPVVGQPRRPFQGWRYLRGEDAPRDISGRGARADVAALPQELEEALADFGVL